MELIQRTLYLNKKDGDTEISIYRHFRRSGARDKKRRRTYPTTYRRMLRIRNLLPILTHYGAKIQVSPLDNQLMVIVHVPKQFPLHEMHAMEILEYRKAKLVEWMVKEGGMVENTARHIVNTETRKVTSSIHWKHWLHTFEVFVELAIKADIDHITDSQEFVDHCNTFHDLIY